MRTAREKVRVAHALAKLPEVHAAFARGELSYAKVRAITRIAEPHDEETLLVWARHGNAAHIAQIASLWLKHGEEAPVMAQHRDRFSRRLDRASRRMASQRFAPMSVAAI